MKPPFAYYGGKVALAPRLAALLAPHGTYIEPFFGSGAVLFAKPRARNEIINDRDHNVVTFFRVLRDHPAELEQVCRLTPHARAEYAAADLDAPDLSDVERARRFWVRVNQSFAKTARRRTGWSITTARSQSIPGTIHARLARFAPAADRLVGCSIECCDAADLIDRLATADTAIYADPPYLASTRRGRAGDYRHDMGDEAAHHRLADALHTTPAAVVLSGYPSPLYDQLYRDWERLEIPVVAHSSDAATGRRRTARTEVIWTNRPAPAGRLFEDTAT